MIMRSTMLVLLLLLGRSAWSQDPGSAAEAPAAADDTPTEVPAADETADQELPDENAEDADLDEQTYERDDDVFVPTEEIPVDESIPFPTDI